MMRRVIRAQPAQAHGYAMAIAPDMVVASAAAEASPAAQQRQQQAHQDGRKHDFRERLHVQATESHGLILSIATRGEDVNRCFAGIRFHVGEVSSMAAVASLS